MAFLVKATGVKAALEVGVFTGYSALAVALALPADGQVDRPRCSDEWTSIGRRFLQEAGVADRIYLRLAPVGDGMTLARKR